MNENDVYLYFDYEFDLQKKTIRLIRQIVEKTELVIKPYYEINGTRYQTILGPKCEQDANGCFHASLQRIVIQDGVKASENCECLFFECSDLIEADLRGLDTSETRLMGQMFYGCTKLETILMDGWNTGQVESFYQMFRSTSCQQIDLGSFSFQNACNMEQMFMWCEETKEIRMGVWISSKLKTTRMMFKGCSKLEKLKAEMVFLPNLTQVDNMFYDCVKLREVDLSEKMLGGSRMYLQVKDCCRIFLMNKRKDGENTNPTCLQNVKEQFAFDLDEETKTIHLLRQKTQDSRLFINKSYLVDGQEYRTVVGEDADTDSAAVFSDALEEITFEEGVLAKKYLNGFFRICKNLKKADLRGLDVRNVRSMQQMFFKCRKLKEVELGNFFGLDLKSMRQMFYGCVSLSVVEADHYVLPELNDVTEMFYECKNLSSLDLFCGKTAENVTKTDCFSGCSRLHLIRWETKKYELPSSLCHWAYTLDTNYRVIYLEYQKDTAKCVTICNSYTVNGIRYHTKLRPNLTHAPNIPASAESGYLQDTALRPEMDEMFFYTGIQVVYIECDVELPKDCSWLFYNCKDLRYLHMGDVDLTAVHTMNHMFENCESLRVLYFPMPKENGDGCAAKCSLSIFENCRKKCRIVVGAKTYLVGDYFGKKGE